MKKPYKVTNILASCLLTEHAVNEMYYISGNIIMSLNFALMVANVFPNPLYAWFYCEG